MISLILSGGVGSRLWPVSREKLPKQFSQLFGETLFSQTCKRLQARGDVFVCTAESMRGLTESAIRQQDLKVKHTFYEPMGRNTAPAIGIVCHYLQNQNMSEEVMGVFPSDHWIEKNDTFNEVLQLAERCALQDQVVTIGLKPTYPATGFGYIECSNDKFAIQDEFQAYPVIAFKEKPNAELAESYLKSGNYFWNSGMFVFKIQTMIDAFKNYLPKMWTLIESINADFSNFEDIYTKITPESIDFGIMEKLKSQVNIPCDIGWSDLGSWDDIAQATANNELDECSNKITEQASNCYTYSDNDKTICLSHVENLIVVDTRDALLVTKKGQTQSVKNIVDKLKKVSPQLTKDHTYEYRPWGFYNNIHEEETFKVKVIDVDPGQQLSYQSHQRRTEIWITVMGKGEVVVDDNTTAVSRGKIIEIPQGSKHRMRNTGEGILKFVEVQIGDYFGEDDITRYLDDYQRV